MNRTKQLIILCLLMLTLISSSSGYLFSSGKFPITTAYPTGDYIIHGQTVNVTFINFSGSGFYMFYAPEQEAPPWESHGVNYTGLDCSSGYCGSGILSSDISGMYISIVHFEDIGGGVWRFIPVIAWHEQAETFTSPVVDFSYSVSGKNLTVTDTSTGFSPLIYFYDWGDLSPNYIGSSVTTFHNYASNGTYTVTHDASDYSNITVEMNKTINIGVNTSGINPVEEIVALFDASTGGLISSSYVSIYNYNTHNWINGSTTGGIFRFTANLSEIFAAYGSATNYNPAIQNYLTVRDESHNILLSPISTGYTDNTTSVNITSFRLKVFDASTNEPLENSLETIYNATFNPQTQSGYTNSLGYIEFPVYTNGSSKYMKIISIKPNYYTDTGYYTISGTTSEISVYLLRKTTAPTPTYTQPTTATPTITPVTTGAAWSTNETAICGVLSTDSSFVDYFKNLLACNGLRTALSQSIALAALIIILFVVVGGKYGKGIGSAIGGIIGFVIAFTLGLIPFVVLALVLVILVLLAIIILGARIIQ